MLAVPDRPDPIAAKKHLGRALVALRDELGVTQEDLAWRIQMDVRYLRRIEKGGRSVGWYTVLRFLAGLNATFGQLARHLDQPCLKPSPGEAGSTQGPD